VSFILTCHCRRPVFVEVKSRARIASKVQKGVRAKVMAAGAECWMARCARAALMALRLSGGGVRRPWKPPELKALEGPFADPTKRLPQAPGWRLIDGRSHGDGGGRENALGPRDVKGWPGVGVVGTAPASVSGAGCQPVRRRRNAIRSCTKSGRRPGVFGAPRQKSLWSAVIIEQARARKRKEAFQGSVLK
jgi:hypothetical protein